MRLNCRKIVRLFCSGQAAVATGNRCCPSFPACILLCRHVILCAIANSIASTRTFFLPRLRNLRKERFPLAWANEPSACMLRFILSWAPYSVVIRSSDSSPFCFITLETFNRLFRSVIGVLQLLPWIHLSLQGHPVQLSHSYTVTVLT